MAWLKTTNLVLTDHAYLRYNERLEKKTKEAILEEARHSDRISQPIKNLMFKKDNKVAYWTGKDVVFIIKKDKKIEDLFVIVTVLNLKELRKRKIDADRLIDKGLQDISGIKCIRCLTEDVLADSFTITGYCYDCGKGFHIIKKVKYISSKD